MILTAKNKTFLLVSILFTIFVVILVSTIYIDQKNKLENAQNSFHKNMHESYKKILAKHKEFYYNRTIANINSSGVRETFAAHDRNKLYDLTKGRWKTLQKENPYLKIMHFYLPDGISFLQMHDPAHYGDRIADIRPMIAKVHQSKKVISGFENAQTGLVFRIIAPIFNQGNYIGALEFGSNPAQILHDIKYFYGLEGALFVKDVPINCSQNTISIHDYTLQSDTLKDESILKYLKKINYDFKITKTIDLNGKEYSIYAFDLYDFSGKVSAKALFVQDITALHKEFRQTILNLSLLVIVLFVFVLLVINYGFQKIISVLDNTNALFKSYVEATDHSSIVSKSDLSGKITYVNENFIRISGYTADEVIGKPHSILRDPDMPSDTFKSLWETIESKKTWKGIIKNRSKDGHAYFIDAIIMPILDEFNNIIEYIAIRHDITELINQREALSKIAYTNPLSMLPNRAKLLKDIESEDYYSIVLIDINRFSQINDVYGQIIGDKLLVQIARYLNDLKMSYTLYHLSGDEFGFVDHENKTEQFIKDIHTIITQLNIRRFTIDQYELFPNIRGGISSGENNLLANADIALKLAKSTRQDCVVYDPKLSLNEKYADNLKWIADIADALIDDRFVVYYQKIIDNKTLSGGKYEALVRMIDREGKIISPFKFLEISKQSKQYNAITRIVIEKVFLQFETLSDKCSINLTIEDILNDDLRQHLIECILSHNIGPRLIFEIVESEGIDNFETVIDFIDTIKSYGCHIAIDDFGTGYSNFEYLMRLKADYIKIDGSIIKNIETDPNAQAVVKAIVFFAQECGIKTIAEFVETEEIYKSVCKFGIDYSQGYYFSKPEPMESKE